MRKSFLLGLIVFLFVLVPSVLAVSQAPVRKANALARLTAAKLKACQNRENNIKKRSEQLAKRADNMEDVFAKIATRVENYYTTKAVPQGKTVADYDSLVSSISAKKTMVDTAVADAKAKAMAFDCNSADPKAQLTAYRESMQSVIKALKEYRTSVRNLIVAVRSAVGAENRAKPSVTEGVAK